MAGDPTPNTSGSRHSEGETAVVGAPPGELHPPTLGREDGDERSDDAPPDLPRYEIRGELGRGGLGVVYDAWDPELERPVALKIIRSRSGGAQAFDRFVREAKALAQLSHPNVVSIYDVGRYDDGRGVFLVMERLEGVTLTRWLDHRERSHAEIVAVFTSAGRGLAAAHAAQVIHRDFKPDNVMVAPDGAVNVVDFGLAVIGVEPTDATTTAGGVVSGGIASRLTQTGFALGTPRYMAPEQHSGQPVTAAADQFAFCAALLASLRGVSSVHPAGLEALVTAKQTGNILPAPVDDTTPPRIEAALVRGLSPKPSDRWPSLDDLLAELTRPQRRAWPVVLGLAATASAVAFALASPDSATEHARCVQNAQQALEFFDDEAAAVARSALAALEDPLGAAAVLDRWSARAQQRWREAAQTTCTEREDDDATFDQRLVCLRSVASRWQVLLERIGGDEPNVDLEVGEWLARAPDAAACLESATLADGPPMPDDAASRPKVEAVRTQLERARVEANAGRIESARTRLEQAMREANALGFAPLVAEVHHATGVFRRERSEYEAALTHFDAAVTTAEAAGDDRAAGKAAAQAAFLAAARMGDVDEARQRLRRSEALLERVGGHPDVAAEVRQAQFAVFSAQGRYDAAEQVMLEVLEIQPRETDADRLDRATLLGNAAIAAARQGKDDLALARFAEVVELRRAVLGARHPVVGLAMLNLGHVQQTLSDKDEALATYQTAYDILTSHRGVDPRAVAQVLNGMSNVHRFVGDYDEALDKTEAALNILRRDGADDGLDVALTLMNTATSHRRLGNLEQALRLSREALDIRERLLAPGHPVLAQSLYSLGSLELEARNFDEAETLLSRALAIRTEAYGDNHRETVRDRVALVFVALDRQRLEDALPHFDRLRTLADAMAEDDDLAPWAWLAIGEVELARERYDDATTSLERALRSIEVTGAGPRARGDSRYALAKARRALGDHGRAQTLLDAAIEDFTLDGPGSTKQRDEAKALAEQWGR